MCVDERDVFAKNDGAKVWQKGKEIGKCGRRNERFER